MRNAVNRAVSYGVCAAVDELDAREDLRVGEFVKVSFTMAVDDVFEDIAAARVVRGSSTQYLHLARQDNEWRIVNSLQEQPNAGGIDLGRLGPVTEGLGIEEGLVDGRDVLAHLAAAIGRAMACTGGVARAIRMRARGMRMSARPSQARPSSCPAPGPP
jgi:enoyl-CoA hydratase